ncbi:MAG: pyroglutamyl-peptidase I [Polaromonas sp. 35-63-240]|nr:MAG: pyroglutamyl-peptidase I [Polaromonas sp. 35-63-240]
MSTTATAARSRKAAQSNPSPALRPPAPRVLLTGFDPFGDARDSPNPINPSWLAVRAVFDASLTELHRLLRTHKPALVICVGQAGGRGAVSLERVAINVNDARIPDNAGAQPVDAPVARNGPAAYFSTLPIKAMLLALQRQGVPAEVSQTAGTFVCNHVFYGLMHALATQRGMKRTRGGFVHVPFLPEQGSPALPLDVLVAALRQAVATALATPQDISAGAGAIS